MIFLTELRDYTLRWKSNSDKVESDFLDWVDTDSNPSRISKTVERWVRWIEGKAHGSYLLVGLRQRQRGETVHEKGRRSRRRKKLRVDPREFISRFNKTIKRKFTVKNLRRNESYLIFSMFFLLHSNPLFSLCSTFPHIIFKQHSWVILFW